jgi:hypothetical protein
MGGEVKLKSLLWCWKLETVDEMCCASGVCVLIGMLTPVLSAPRTTASSWITKGNVNHIIFCMIFVWYLIKIVEVSSFSPSMLFLFGDVWIKDRMTSLLRLIIFVQIFRCLCSKFFLLRFIIVTNKLVHFFCTQNCTGLFGTYRLENCCNCEHLCWNCSCSKVHLGSMLY